MKDVSKKIHEEADRLTEQLKENNIWVMRYDAKHTNSVYLKLDFGVLGTIRISDHITPNRYYSQKYNVIFDGAYRKNTYRNRLKCYFYNEKNFKRNLVSDILRHKQRIIEERGIHYYNLAMRKHQIIMNENKKMAKYTIQ